MLAEKIVFHFLAFVLGFCVLAGGTLIGGALLWVAYLIGSVFTDDIVLAGFLGFLGLVSVLACWPLGRTILGRRDD